MVDATIEGSLRIVPGYHTFQVDRKIWALRQIYSADSMDIVSTIRTTSGTIEILVDVSFGSEVPCVLTAGLVSDTMLVIRR